MFKLNCITVSSMAYHHKNTIWVTISSQTAYSVPETHNLKRLILRKKPADDNKSMKTLPSMQTKKTCKPATDRLTEMKHAC